MSPEKLQALRRIEARLKDSDFPPQIVIETAAFCNFRCRHCHHASLKRKKGHMARELWTKIIREIAEKRPDAEVWPTFYGDALVLGKKFFAMAREARQLGLANMVLNSNGSFCRDWYIDEILTCGLSKFLLSLDGFTKETFEYIRYTLDPHGKFEPVYAGVRQLIERKKQLDAEGVETPTIICQFSQMDENEHETDAFTEYWLGLGADVKVREKLTWTGFVPAPNLTKNFPERIACPWAINTCAIHWNGDVVACAPDNEGKFIGGNLNEKSLEEIWTTTMRDLRKAHFDHRWDDLPHVCLSCLDWQAVGAAFHKPTGEKYVSVAASL